MYALVVVAAVAEVVVVAAGVVEWSSCLQITRLTDATNTCTTTTKQNKPNQTTPNQSTQDHRERTTIAERSKRQQRLLVAHLRRETLALVVDNVRDKWVGRKL
eukprot:m.118938 g.118938  ORF g.118938 m.118938 type:complete len:103 (-) comp28711_c1_seq2:1901-2209(-)